MHTSTVAQPNGNQPHAMAEGETHETVETRFGVIAINRAAAIRFPEGLLGMPDMRDFCLAELPSSKMRRFKLLQCLNDPALSFIVMPLEKGDILAEADLAEALGGYEIAPESLLVLLIVSVHRSPDAVRLSVNARAPLLVDSTRRAAWQYVFTHDGYQVRHMLGQ